MLMLYARDRSLEDYVVENLLRAPMTVKTLTATLARNPRKPKLRAVYQAVNKLIDDEVLTKEGKVVHVKTEWTRVVGARFAIAPIPQLGVGEKAVYSFTSFAHLDAFWRAALPGLEAIERSEQIFFYHPHDFWTYLPNREEGGEAYYRHFALEKKYAFFTVGGNAPADQEFKKAYQDRYLQIVLHDGFSWRRSDHLTILGNYLVTVRIPRKLATDIDTLYTSGRSIAAIKPKILALLAGRRRLRLSIEHNPVKAQSLRKKLSLNFYFKMD